MSDVVGPASLALSQGISAFQFFLPKLSEVRRADASTNPEIVGDVRLGEVAATALCVGVGTMVSSLTGSSVPALVAAVIALILICVYETALRGNRIGEPRRVVRSEDA